MALYKRVIPRASGITHTLIAPFTIGRGPPFLSLPTHKGEITKGIQEQLMAPSLELFLFAGVRKDGLM